MMRSAGKTPRFSHIPLSIFFTAVVGLAASEPAGALASEVACIDVVAPGHSFKIWGAKSDELASHLAEARSEQVLDSYLDGLARYARHIEYTVWQRLKYSDIFAGVRADLANGARFEKLERTLDANAAEAEDIGDKELAQVWRSLLEAMAIARDPNAAIQFVDGIGAMTASVQQDFFAKESRGKFLNRTLIESLFRLDRDSKKRVLEHANKRLLVIESKEKADPSDDPRKKNPRRNLEVVMSVVLHDRLLKLAAALPSYPVSDRVKVIDRYLKPFRNGPRGRYSFSRVVKVADAIRLRFRERMAPDDYLEIIGSLSNGKADPAKSDIDVMMKPALQEKMDKLFVKDPDRYRALMAKAETNAAKVLKARYEEGKFLNPVPTDESTYSLARGHLTSYNGLIVRIYRDRVTLIVRDAFADSKHQEIEFLLEHDSKLN